MPSVPSVAEIKNKGFDKSFWQKHRDSKVSGHGVGKKINEVRKIADKGGMVAAKYVPNGDALIKVQRIYKNLFDVLENAKKTATDYGRKDTIKFCQNFMQAVKERQLDAQTLCEQALNSAADIKKNEDIKTANELKKVLQGHLVTLKGLLKNAVDLHKVSTTNLGVIKTLMKKNPPSPQELAVARQCISNLTDCSKQWGVVGKDALKFAPTWNLKKYPEHSKKVCADVLKTLDTTHGAILTMLKGKIQMDEVHKAADEVEKAEARMYAAAVKPQGDKASQLLIKMKNLEDSIADSMVSLRASMKNKKADPTVTFNTAETMEAILVEGLKKLAVKATELRSMNFDVEAKSWLPAVTRHFTSQTKLHLKAITAAKLALPKTTKTYKNAKTEVAKMLKVLSKEMEGA